MKAINLEKRGGGEPAPATGRAPLGQNAAVKVEDILIGFAAGSVKYVKARDAACLEGAS
ncbi:MAG: hypothetical protein LAQ30_15890 [Acidobacteriia bacterium]|nr:hypothetical protein [Terriglobia bacterium]